MRTNMQTRFAALTAFAFLVVGCDSGPQQLASTLDAAIKAGDMNAAQALHDRTSVPFEQSIYLEMVADCVEEGATCKVCTGPLPYFNAMFVQESLEASRKLLKTLALAWNLCHGRESAFCHKGVYA